ncbi:MAG: ABC transporter ATP-binding protein [Defluviitaleaceae bacterium]|nr:ABC transporter ATP-binding protein [Defluviitaleaceae bacterium]
MPISLKNVSKSFAGKLVFCNATMSLRANRPTVIMGRNGCGKSTLLKIIAGVLAHTEGEIVRRPGIKISYAPDRFPKLPFKVGDYLLHMGRIQGISDSDINKYADSQFDRFGIPENIKQQVIYKCSKGTIQKVNIMQAFLTKPDLLVMDEPFSGLDESSVEELIRLLAETSDTAVIISCHEKLLAQRITADNLYVFDKQSLVKSSEISNRVSIKIIPGDAGDFFNDKIISTDTAEDMCEIVIEKENLKEILFLLLENGHEIYSVNPREC